MGKWQSEFDNASTDDKAYAIATHRTRALMRAYEEQRAEEQAGSQIKVK